MGMGTCDQLGVKDSISNILDELSDGALIVNGEGKILYINKRVYWLLGFTESELLGTNIKKIYANSTSKSASQSTNSEVRLRRCNGEILNCFVFTKPLKGKGEDNLYYKLIKTKENPESKDGLKNIKKMLIISGEINHLIAWERDSRSLLRKICKSLAKLREELDVWVGLFEKGKLEIVESTGYKREKLEDLADKGEIICLEAIANENKKVGPIPVNHLCENCSLNGDRSIKKLVIPLTHENRLYGVLWIHSNSDDFTSEELGMINDLAGDLALALKTIEIERERNEALDKMKDNLEYFEYLADRLRNPLAIMRGYVDVKEEIGGERAFKELSNQINRMNRILDNLRTKEEETIKLRENLTK